jgi:hypothetical protein
LVASGIVSHAPLAADCHRPYSKMVAFLDQLDTADPPVPAPRRVRAALGPLMLVLAGGGSDRLVNAVVAWGDAGRVDGPTGGRTRRSAGLRRLRAVAP